MIRSYCKRSVATTVIVMSCLLMLGVAVSAQDAYFLARRDIALNSFPVSAAAGDFNQDFIPDLAFVSSSPRALSVLLSDGQGGFFSRRDHTLDEDPRTLVAGDFDRDGNLDAAVASRLASAILVYIGDGQGGFRLPARRFAVSNPSLMKAEDFNGDGNLDLAVANEFQDLISILDGDGQGSFRPPRSINIQRRDGVFLGVSDFNGDQNRDLVMLSRNGSELTVLLGNGQGGFSAPRYLLLGSPASSLAAADFNSDGHVDLAVGYPSSSTRFISLLFGDGEGGFSSPVHYGTQRRPLFVEAADFDNDNYMDLAVIHQPETFDALGGVSILRGDGLGVFVSVQNFDVGRGPSSGFSVDLNGDGSLDLITVNTGSNTVSTLLGDGLSGLSVARSFPAGVNPVAMVTGDFNRDGHVDVIAANLSSGSTGGFTLLLGDGKGQFAPPRNFAVGSDIAAIATGDFNRDSCLDLAMARRTFTGQIALMNGNCQGGFSDLRTVAVNDRDPNLIAAHDLNGDNNLDLVVISGGFEPSRLSTFLGNGQGGFSPPRATPLGRSSVTALAIEDFNADGRADVALAYFNNNIVSILQGDGQGAFMAARDFGTGINPRALAAADLNQDFYPDLVVANTGSNDLDILLADGFGGFEVPRVIPGARDPRSVLATDLNLDGFLDLAVATFGADSVMVILGDGTGRFYNPQNFSIARGPAQVLAEDFYKDGRTDLVTIHSTGSVSMLINYTMIPSP